MIYDKIIIGAGLYGMYAALKCAPRGEKILILEYDPEPFMRATYINQARVHMGYHYPRSYSTAIKSAHYFERFCGDYGFCIFKGFDQIYAMSEAFSWTDAKEFHKFCEVAHIPCEEIPAGKYFKSGMCSGAFRTREYTYDAKLLCRYFLEKLAEFSNVELRCNVRIKEILQTHSHFRLDLGAGKVETGFLLNAAYASTNQVLSKIRREDTSSEVGYEPFKIKYELCEIILCRAGDKLKNVGLTVMDGPFFSIMPFGKTGFHSLTAVTFTPHMTSFDILPHFSCQSRSEGICSAGQLGNCSECLAKPSTAFPYMASLARKYIRPEYGFMYERSLFSMKPILQASEIDDSRPTVVRELCHEPRLISVLSGKINTVYDLDDVLVV